MPGKRAAVGLLAVELPIAVAAVWLLIENLQSKRDESIWLAAAMLGALLWGWLAPKRYWIPLRVSILSIFAGFSAVEVWLRVAPPRAWEHTFDRLPDMFEDHPNPLIGYWYRKGLVFRGVTISDQRLLEPERSIPKPPGVRRVLVLGDSTVQQIDEYQRLYPVTLQRLLRGAAPPGITWEVINAGIVGYNTRQEVERYKLDLWKFEPDIVVVGYCLNDPYPETNGVWSVSRFRFLRILTLNLEQLRRRSIYDIPALHQSRHYHEIVELPLKELAALAHQRNQKTLAFIFPFLNVDERRYPPIYRQVETTFRGNGYAFVDLHSGWTQDQFFAFRQRESPEDTIHPNGDFHDMIAQRLFDAIQANGWLGADQPSSPAGDK